MHFAVRPRRTLLIGSIDKDVVPSRWWEIYAELYGTSSSLISGRVVPVLNGVCAEVNVVVGRSWTVDSIEISVKDRCRYSMYLQDGSYSTVTVLSAEVRMVPTRAVLGSTESISFRISWGKSTFRDSIDLHISNQFQAHAQIFAR